MVPEYRVWLVEMGVWDGRAPARRLAATPKEAAESVCGEPLVEYHRNPGFLRAEVRLFGARPDDDPWWFSTLP